MKKKKQLKNYIFRVVKRYNRAEKSGLQTPAFRLPIKTHIPNFNFVAQFCGEIEEEQPLFNFKTGETLII